MVTPWKNSTFATVPSVSDAVALMVTVAGAVNVAPFAGETMETAGGVLLPHGLKNNPLTTALGPAVLVTLILT